MGRMDHRRFATIALLCALVAPGANAFAVDGDADADADERSTIVMQAYSEPGESGEIVVFVGEQVDYAPKDVGCDGDCWVFDRWHTARYRVAAWIHGVPPGPEVVFSVAEHAPREPFGHSRYALVFLERFDDAWALVKYQQMPVHPTAGGGFASCGPLGDDADRDDDPEFAGYPPLEDVTFSPALVVDETGRLSANGWRELHDPRWHDVIGEHVVCTRGVPVERIARFMAGDDAMLKAALPTLAGGE